MHHPRAIVRRVARPLLVVGVCTIALFPFYWMARTSVASSSSVFFDGISLVPDAFEPGNYSRAWTEADLGRSLVNGLVVVLAILVMQLLTCIPAAYAFSKLRFRGSGVLLAVVLASLLVPVQATAVPTYVGLNVFGLVDTRIALVLPFVTSAFGIFLLRQHMITIPDALIDAARVDGLGPLRTLLRVVVPLSRPAIASLSVFSVWVHWNDYMWPLLVARSPELRTPPLSLAVFQNADLGVDYSGLAAAALVVTLPIVLLFGVAQRRFVQGISGSEVTG